MENIAVIKNRYKYFLNINLSVIHTVQKPERKGGRNARRARCALAYARASAENQKIRLYSKRIGQGSDAKSVRKDGNRYGI